jgi:nucleoside-diphosphate-sugar epimerase
MMLEHGLPAGYRPHRVVIVGSAGFVGAAIAARLLRDQIAVVGITRQQVDLLAADGEDRLAALLRDGDSIVAAAAIAPCKNPAQLRDNATMTATMVAAIKTVDAAHVVNISSDAVFIDLDTPLNEDSPKAPDSLHGVMHLGREIAFRSELSAPLAILRPTLIYGSGDPHNGYGPNQFRRRANRGEAITLFGQGEERRDHVHIDDVAELAVRCLNRRSRGSLNIATGVITRFLDVATLAAELAPQRVEIQPSPRRGPMPHNGYRAFDIAASHSAFPDFCYRSLAEGMAAAQQQEFPHG